MDFSSSFIQKLFLNHFDCCWKLHCSNTKNSLFLLVWCLYLNLNSCLISEWIFFIMNFCLQKQSGNCSSHFYQFIGFLLQKSNRRIFSFKHLLNAMKCCGFLRLFIFLLHRLSLFKLIDWRNLKKSFMMFCLVFTLLSE